jgi:NADPH-dependent 2,4-dienoyl-CoA reductase/sulfur reductase-like enzyme
MTSSEIVTVLIAATTSADVHALETPLIKVHGIRIVGADAWEDVEMLHTAVRSFYPRLLVATPDFPVPDDLGIPCLRVAASEAPAAAVKRYLSESVQPEASSDPVSSESRPDPSARPAPQLNLPAPQVTARLGFWGARGGVGTTTAALEAAAQLAERGLRVALCDATKRGDTFLWAGFKPQTQPSTSQKWPGITFFPDLPSAEQLQPFPAVVIDGGRQPRERNVDWVRVAAPLSAEAIERLVDKQC